MPQPSLSEARWTMEPAQERYIQPEALPLDEGLTIETPRQQTWPVAEPLKWAPTRLNIPAIGVETGIVGVGITSDGAMEAPSAYDQVGWLRTGALPGEVGRAVLAGHVDSRTGPAIFYRLRDLQPGDIVEVTMGSTGELLRFEVRETAQYPETDAPLDRIFGPSDRQELVLITCAGSFDRNRGAYDQRLVVYAELQMPDAEQTD